MSKEMVTVVIEAQVPFHSYDSEKKNQRARAGIKKWLLETLRNEAAFIPLYVETDRLDGSLIEDCTGQVRFKLKK